MIVKVQISQFDSEGRCMMLVYDKSREVYYEDEATKDVLNKMDGKSKKFFEAEVIPHPINWAKGENIIQIGEEAEWQKW